MRITELVDVVVQRAIRRVSVGEEQVHHEVFMRLTKRAVDYPEEIQNLASITATHYMTEVPQIFLILTMAGIHTGETIVRKISFHELIPDEATVDRAVMTELADMREEKVLQARRIERTTAGGN